MREVVFVVHVVNRNSLPLLVVASVLVVVVLCLCCCVVVFTERFTRGVFVGVGNVVGLVERAERHTSPWPS